MTYRLVNENDAAAFLEFFRIIVSETDNLACSESEAEAMTEEDEKNFIRSMLILRRCSREWHNMGLLRYQDTGKGKAEAPR